MQTGHGSRGARTRHRIDLVAKLRNTEGWCAIQCKFWLGEDASEESI